MYNIIFTESRGKQMPVIKIKNNDVCDNTHTSSEIIYFTASVPANVDNTDSIEEAV